MTGSQTMYGEASLQTVSEHSARLAEVLDGLDSIPVRIVQRPTATSPEAILRLCREANDAERLRGDRSRGCTRSRRRRCGSPGSARCRSRCCISHTQFNRDLPWAEIDMDFMNLAQSAHGDREFGHLVTRMGLPRKTVVGHVSDPTVGRRIGLWSRAAAGWHEAHQLRRRALRRQHARGCRDGGRQGRGADPSRCLGQRLRHRRARRRRGGLAVVRGRRARRRVRRAATRSRRALRAAGERRESLRDAARIEAGLRTFLTAGGFKAFTDTFEDLGGLRQLPGIAVQRLMADGYGFGAEGDWKTAALLRVLKVMARGFPAARRSWRTTRTTSRRTGRRSSARTCSRSVPRSPARRRRARSIRSRSAAGRIRSGSSSRPPRARRSTSGCSTSATRFRLVVNRVDVVAPDEELPRLPVARALWKPQPEFATAAEAWLLAGAPHHTVLTTALDDRAADRLRRDRGDRAPRDRRGDPHPRVQERAALEPGLLSSRRRPLIRHEELRRRVCEANLALVARGAGVAHVRQRQRARPLRGRAGDQAERGAVRRADARVDRDRRPRYGSRRRRRAAAVVRYSDAPRPLPRLRPRSAGSSTRTRRSRPRGRRRSARSRAWGRPTPITSAAPFP